MFRKGYEEVKKNYIYAKGRNLQRKDYERL